MTPQQVKHLTQLGGMDFTTRSHLLGDQKWRLLHNVRCNATVLEQVPPPTLIGFAIPQSNETLLALGNLPSPVGDYGTMIGLTETQCLRLGLTYSTPLLKDGLPLVFNTNTEYNRWSMCKHNNRLFFVNPLNPVRYTDGVEVKDVGALVPSGRYVEVFFDHLVIGSPAYNGVFSEDRVIWSNLKDYSNFTPGTASEADHYLFTEHQRVDDVISGLTGMVLYKNVCMLFTYSAVYIMQYRGLNNKIVRVDPLLTDCGSGYRYSVTRLDSSVVWIDDKHKNFLLYNGGQPEVIGNDICDYFFNDLNQNENYAQRTHVYVNQAVSEVGWIYCSISSTFGIFDKAVVYNYGNKTWSVRSMQNVHCHISANRRAAVASDIVTRASYYSTITAPKLTETTERFDEFWGGANTMMLRDATFLSPDDTVLTTEHPVLETGDFLYESLKTVKEVKDVTVNAQSLDGVIIEVNGRKAIDDLVTYTNVGTWLPTLKEEYLTFAPVVGKVLRYRFTSVGHGTPVIIKKAAQTITGFSLRCNVTDLNSQTAFVTINGYPDTLYPLDLYVRGSFEFHRYSGGVNTGYVNAEGTPAVEDADRMIVQLVVAGTGTYYLNRIASAPEAYSTFVKYRLALLVYGGSIITLSMGKTTPIALYSLDVGGGTPKASEITGIVGEYCQIDLVNTLTTDINMSFNGNTRNFIWSAFEENVQIHGATR